MGSVATISSRRSPPPRLSVARRSILVPVSAPTFWSRVPQADLFWCTTQGGHTELPFISIAAEAWRGLRDCGEALRELAASLPPSQAAEAAHARKLAAEMSAAAPSLLTDLHASIRASAFPDPLTTSVHNTTCHPYVAGAKTCAHLDSAPSARDSEPWRTYAEALYSGGLPTDTTTELYEWHRYARCLKSGSRLKLGVLTGSGLDATTGDVLETFTHFGWGYALLQAGLIEPFLMQVGDLPKSPHFEALP